GVREAVGQHSFGHRGGPLAQDLAGLTQPAGRQAQPAQGDEVVAPPVREPRVSGDDGLAPAAPYQVGVRRTVEPRREEGAPFQFVLAVQVEADLRRYLLTWSCALVVLGGEDQDGP